MHLDRQRTLHALLLIAGMTVAGIFAAFAQTPTANAQALEDSQCRGCHGDNENALTLPSGEMLPLLVNLDAFDSSAHGHAAEMSCSSCHTGKQRYRYPHEPLPDTIVTQEDYTSAAIAETCVTCHYAHNPFHEDAEVIPATGGEGEDAVTELPNCVSCHSAHSVAPVEEMATTMPERCLACHDQETADWLQSALTPHPGVGDGAAGYAGSTRCLGCHEDLYTGWQETRHARSVQFVDEHPDAVVGDFASEDPDLAFNLDEVALTLGAVRQQKYITQTVSGDFYVLPSQWNVVTAEWAPYQPDSWQEHEWRRNCSGCHVTGLETTTWEFTEFNIGCEECHGPSLAHAQAPEEVKPYRAADDQVCGACHSRGASPDGHPFPATYVPGDTLTDHFTFTTDEADLWPDSSAENHNQQYMDWTLGNSMEQDDSVRCSSCHDVHSAGAEGTAQLYASINETCLGCHNDKRRLVEHMPYHEVASRTNEFTCADCHMPKMATSAVSFDTRSHTFLQPDPQGSITHGSVDVMPNACNLCHAEPSEDPAWAAQTIAYAKDTWPDLSSQFGPGPTPTSPPPPTPLPSVGEPVERMEIEAGGWIRDLFFVIVAVIGMIVAAAIVHYVRTRREQNV